MGLGEWCGRKEEGGFGGEGEALCVLLLTQLLGPASPARRERAAEGGHRTLTRAQLLVLHYLIYRQKSLCEFGVVIPIDKGMGGGWEWGKRRLNKAD